MNRRAFITLLGGAAAASSVLRPLATQAQQTAMPVIGFLSSRSPGESAGAVAAFRQGLREVGLVEGQNLVIAARWAEGRYDRLPALAAELVDMRAAVVLAAGGPSAAFAARAATSTTPIVFSAVSDPVLLGLVASLNRPGGNLTGMSILVWEIATKSAQLLKDLIPEATTIAYLVNPSTAGVEIYAKETATAASALGITIHLLNASTEQDLDEAFASLARLGARGLVVPGDPFFETRREKIVGLAAGHAVPTIYTFREYAVAGGLMSYGASLPDSYRRAALYVGRILADEKPAELPVQSPVKYELAINLKTARALGLEVSQILLARADEVIE
jgi:putative ABC transport system substrate-binding protein